MLRTDWQSLAKLFRAQVMMMHKEENLIDDRFVAIKFSHPLFVIFVLLVVDRMLLGLYAYPHSLNRHAQLRG